MTPPLEGKRALVTGASKGVGKGIAIELARAGCDVAINYNSDAEGAAETVRVVRETGRQATAVGGHVGRGADVERMFAEAETALGPIDILVNNAGVQTWKALLDLTEQEWDRVMDTNLKGCFLCTKRAASAMAARGTGGAIINIGSGCNKVAFPHLVDYTASKGGIEQFTKVAAVELGRHAIRVNCVAPGAVEIERTKLESGDYANTWAGLTPLGRVGLPADIGHAVVFLAGPQAAFITGQTIWVDGGLFAKPHWPYET
ncbi:MAG: 3-oxoacyl-ACP reductase FabG [Acidobacteria bacterium]|nr:3-oxoacyl-ACP reductase FabG [Acidobacteriota bacterium]